jgi:alcohol dehydrogenase class IV
VLKIADIEYVLYDAVRPNPSIASVLEGGRIAAENHCDFVVGIGGGSPLDAAKVIAVSAANPELDEAGLYSMRWPKEPLPTVLVGTTAGTGSEVTPVSVITDSSARKHSFRGEKLYATLAFGDARYTESMPLPVTASTGVDALAHCLESYFCKKATAVSKAFAVEGICTLLAPLETVAEGVIPTAEEREKLYEGSILGGMAISVTGTILPHNMGYYLTEQHGIPHGFACAVFHPALLRHAAACAPDEMDTLCERIGMDTETLIDLIERLTPKPEVRLSEAEIEALVPRWENANAIKATVGEVTAEKIREILSELFA